MISLLVSSFLKHVMSVMLLVKNIAPQCPVIVGLVFNITIVMMMRPNKHNQTLKVDWAVKTLNN